MQKRKNLRLLSGLIFLIILTATVFLIDENGDRVDVNKDLFAIEDTASISRISISGAGFSNELTKENGQWLVNDAFLLDEGLRRVLLSVLSAVQVRRPVGSANMQEVIQSLKETGVKVEIYQNGRRSLAFWSGGSQPNNVSYFMKAGDERPYVVHLPGYESYVAGLFEIPENDWRDRVVVSTSWQSLRELSLVYPDRPDQNFTIVASGRLFDIPGIENADTASMMDYLEEVTYILADRYIDSGEYPQYDSLAQTQPYAELSVYEIGEEDPESIAFFSALPNDRYVLGLVDSTQLALFDYERIRNLFKTKEDFRKQAVGASKS